MFIAPEVYVGRYKHYSYEELLIVKKELKKELRRSKREYDQLLKNPTKPMPIPGPEEMIWFEIECLKLIQERIDSKTIDKGERK